MIKNLGTQTQEFIQKPVLSEAVNAEDLNMVWKNVAELFNLNTADINALNANMLLALDSAAKESESIVNDIGVLSNKLADIYVITGRSNRSVDLLQDRLNVTESGIEFDKDTLTVALAESSKNIYGIRKITTSSNGGSVGNALEYNSLSYSDSGNLIGSTSRLEIEKINGELYASIHIDLGSAKIVNNISFKLFNLGTRLPVLESVEYSQTGCSYKKADIFMSGSAKVDFNDFRTTKDTVDLEFGEVDARFIKINLSQNFAYSIDQTKRRYAIGLNKLEISLREAIPAGDIIFGPYTSSDEILKVALSARLQHYNSDALSGMVFSVSSNGQEWLDIPNSSFLEADGKSKVINFNNLDTSSIITSEPVNQVYVKIAMTSFKSAFTKKLDYPFERFFAELSTTNKMIILSQAATADNTVVYKVVGPRLGKETVYRKGNTITNVEISEIRLNGEMLIRSVGANTADTYRLTDIISTEDGRVTVSAKADRLFISEQEIVTAETSFDVDTNSFNVFELSKPIFASQQIETISNTFVPVRYKPVLEVLNKAGTYTAEIGQTSITIDLSEGFFRSCAELLIICDDEVDSVTVIDEIGGLIGVFPVELVSGKTVISLANIFDLVIPVIEGRTFNNKYPLVPLDTNEFAILDGQIVFGSYYNGLGVFSRILQRDIDSTLERTLSDMDRVILQEAKKIRRKVSLTEYNLKSIIKLQDTNIVQGTTRFDYSNSSVNSFVKEVPFTDGNSEFQLTQEYVQAISRGTSVILLNPLFLDDGALENYLDGYGSCSEFLKRRVYSEEELIDSGDYHISLVDAGEPKIFLAVDVTTSDISDVTIIYNIVPNSVSRNGLYSIDYRRGIIYTSGPVDGGIQIEYSYSFVFADYTPLEKVLTGNVQIANGQCVVSIDDSDLKEYVAIVSNTPDGVIEINTSPVLTDVVLNIITSGDFL